MGHLRSYTALDVIARKRRMEGKNVMLPIGWDAFGLPTENYALKTGVHPSVITKKNIENFRRQIRSLGYSVDWSREVDTTDPDYYQWTQWIFLQFFKKGLAYQATIPINWCPNDKIGLANEEVVDGKCERCGSPVVRKEQKQWMLKITAYADRLIDDLSLVEYPESVKQQQINWIGRSEGAEIEFRITNDEVRIKVFTTRPDTIFGATYLVLSPEHSIMKNEKLRIKNYGEVQKYIEKVAKKSDLERTDLAKEKTGVELKGLKAINPATKEEIPIWIADYVLASYGTGAIMAVPAHDERDFAFARKFGLPIRAVILPAAYAFWPQSPGDEEDAKEKVKTLQERIQDGRQCFTGEGILVNSGQFDSMEAVEAREKITSWLEKQGVGKKAISFKLRDWVFSRQHYWGEPIPIIHCPDHGTVPVPDDQLPVELPYVEKYEPSGTGESPLANIPEFVNATCPVCSKPAKRETDTMPNWAGSSWYYLRYCDPKNDEKFADKKKLEYWLPVDLYNGGMEHTTLHLLYSRFWHKFLFDQKLVPESEPYKRRTSHGIILGEDGRKMSKSFGNVVNPDDLIKEYGADSVRTYEMFMGPFEDTIPWSHRGIVGVHRFLQNVHDLFQSESKQDSTVENPDVARELEYATHHAIKRVGEDIDSMRFNTSVSTLMQFVNTLRKHESNRSLAAFKNAQRTLLLLLAPFAPHLCSELWEDAYGGDISREPWPTYDEKKLQRSEITLVVQVNGKVRAKVTVPADITQDQALDVALSEPNVAKYVPAKPKKVVFVAGRLINVIV